eukprot:CAMPEP_0168353502 /NCGR_PEP_ID=MMETSP0213-20121227/23299_1 /TAXON_ID=151035 /ORGANISM="Euplotes harpa, Strain FSP1.4" /LENGTH=122 /DNA_ID=CAMNT_0008365145 /DNA_START=149 /DNA_END=514 /DNA_ORIENTATION=+
MVNNTIIKKPVITKCAVNNQEEFIICVTKSVEGVDTASKRNCSTDILSQNNNQHPQEETKFFDYAQISETANQFISRSKSIRPKMKQSISFSEFPLKKLIDRSKYEIESHGIRPRKIIHSNS